MISDAVAPRARIAGTGRYLPPRVLTNHDLESMVETSDEWIRTRTGIRERRIAAPEMGVAIMGAEAGRAALADAGITASEVDLILVSTATPDRLLPSSACDIQALLGADHAAAYDFATACSGFLYGLSMATAHIVAGQAETVLLICSEKMSSIVDWTDRTTCVLFGDGAGAAVIRRADSESGDGHSFDEEEGIAFHQHAIGEGARIPFVGVADDVLLISAGVEDRLPLDARREGGATATAQTGAGDGIDEVSATRRHGLLETAQTAVRFVISDREGIGDADATEGDALLAREELDLVHRSKRGRMRLAVEEAGVEERRHLGRRDVAVSNATIRGRHFNQRLEPIGAARSVAHDFYRLTTDSGFDGDRLRHGISANRTRATVSRHEDANHRAPPLPSSASMSASSLGASTMPCTVPSTITAGESAQLPRQ